MTVPISSVVSVAISSAPTPAGLAGFGTLLFVTPEGEGIFDAGELMRSYSSAGEVAADFTSGEAVQAANAYFGQVPRPTELKVGTTLSAVAALVDNLTALEEYDDSFYGVCLDKSYRDGPDTIAAAGWVQSRDMIFFANTNDSATLSISTQTGTSAKTLQTAAYSNTIVTYGSNVDQYACASVAGRAFTVNFGGTNTTITLFGKKLPGITSSSISSSQKAALENVNCNAFLDVAGNLLYSDGKMAGGGYIDTVHGRHWLQSYIQLAVFNALYLSPTKVPYTNLGIARIVAAVSDALAQGKRNGLLGSGSDEEGNTLINGYAVTSVPLSAVSDADKAARVYSGIGFVAIGAGSLHGITISGSFN